MKQKGDGDTNHNGNPWKSHQEPENETREKKISGGISMESSHFCFLDFLNCFFLCIFKLFLLILRLLAIGIRLSSLFF